MIDSTSTEQFAIKVFYGGSTLFRPEQFFVVEDGLTYTIDTFCGPEQYEYWDSAAASPCTEYFSNGNRFSYDYLELATNSAYLTTLYLHFMDDVLSHPNQTLPGSVSPASI